MTDQQLIIAVAKLDGRNINWDMDTELFYTINDRTRTTVETPPYLTSRDAIIPVIEKICAIPNHDKFNSHVYNELGRRFGNAPGPIDFITMTARELSIALVKATGNYIE